MKKNEGIFQSLIERAALGYQCLDERGNVADTDQAWIDSLGYSREEVTSKWFGDFLAPDDRERFEVMFQELKKSGKIHDDLELVRKDGSRITVSFDGWICRDEMGNFKLAHCVLLNVNEVRIAEHALRGHLTFLESLLEAIPGPVFYKSTDHAYLGCNEAFSTFVGLPREQIIGKSVYDVAPESLARVFRERDEELFRNPGTQVYESSFKCHDGTIRQVMFHKATFGHSNGNVAGLIGVILDITDRKRAEAKIQQQNTFLTGLLEAISHPFYVIDVKDHRVVMANSSARKSFSSGEGTCYALTHGRDDPCNAEHHPCPLERVKHTGRPTHLEHVHYSASGEASHVAIFAYPVKDATGRVRYVVEYAVDVTDRKHSEEERIRLTTAIEQSAEMVVITDTEGTIQYVNPAFERITGYTRQEAIGRNITILKSNQKDEHVDQNMWDTLAGGEVWTGHFVNKKKDGTLFEEDATISPIKDDSNKIVSHVAVKRDVTREVLLQKQLQQAQKMESVGTLAGGIAHDFNNILTIVLGYSELLLADKSRGAAEYEEILAIRQAARRGSDLVKQILTFSRRAEYHPRPMSLNQEVQQAKRLLSRTIPKMIQIDLHLADDLKTVHADPGQMEQILLNLAVNAKDAMPNGGKLVIETRNVYLNDEYCRAHLGVKPGPYVLLTVSDTGHGMEREIMDHVFEPFYTTKQVGEGTGLGLALVFGIVKGHGGHVACYSEPGVGTTFRIYLPALTLEEAPSMDTTLEMPAGGTETILIVDDEDLIGDLGRRILSGAGYTVLTASNGEEALEIYSKKMSDISLVLLDLIMPGMGGERCLKELLKMDPRARVLVASGYSASGPVKQTLERGAKGFVSKPFQMKQLLQAVGKVLNEKV